MPAVVQSLVSDVRVVVFGPLVLSAAELEAHIAEAVAWEPRVRCVLVDVVTGGSLTPRDRVALAKAKLLAKPSAVLVDSRLTRSILTAVSWLGGNMAAFTPGALDEACEHLQIGLPERPRIAQAIGALRSAIG
jgi:hypothetical protein